MKIGGLDILKENMDFSRLTTCASMNDSKFFGGGGGQDLLENQSIRTIRFEV